MEASILESGIECYPGEGNRGIRCSVGCVVFDHISPGNQTVKERMIESREPIQSNLLHAHVEESKMTIRNQLELTCLPSNPSTQRQGRCENWDERNALQSPFFAAYMSTTSGFQGRLTVKTTERQSLEVHKSTLMLRHRRGLKEKCNNILKRRRG